MLRFLCHFAVCSILERFEIKRRGNWWMSQYVYNKHNNTWKVICTAFTHSLFLYQKSQSFAALIRWFLIKGLDGVNWQLINGQNFNWQLTFALGFTDIWKGTWLFFIFYKTLFFKALNGIVSLFSSDNVIKCAFEISGNVPATSEISDEFPKHVQRVPNVAENWMSAHVPKTFGHFWSYLKDDNFSLLWFL